jgi:hypothetical protein
VKAKPKKPPREYARDRVHRVMVRLNDEEVGLLKRLGRAIHSPTNSNTFREALDALMDVLVEHGYPDVETDQDRVRRYTRPRR